MRKVSRRWVLRGLGGTVLALPFLESLRPRSAIAAGEQTDPFAIFFRQACGVAAAGSNDEIGTEPERFWPKNLGGLTADNVNGRALGELTNYLDRMLVVKNINMEGFNYGDGHARGALQGLTARGPTVQDAAGDSEAAGESIDHRIGRELNPDKRDSLFMYSGKSGGWLGGPCISYRGPGQRRSALHDPWAAYQQIVGGDTGLSPEARQALVGRQKSVNDLVRGQLQQLMSRPELSKSDKERVDLHLSSVRDLELALSCKLDANAEAALQNQAPGYDTAEGDKVIEHVKLQMDLAALAVACGHTRSVAIQVGSGNDGANRYPDPATGQLMANNFHWISHRRASHDSSGTVIPGSDVLHHKVDVQFARMFKHLLDKLAAYSTPEGNDLLHHGLAVWYNDNSTGPPHGRKNVPFIVAGSANGQLKQGQYIEVSGGDSNALNHAQMLNTIAAAVGATKNLDGSTPLDDFGDPSLLKGRLMELLV